MNFSSEKKKRGITALEVTPLVDVVFLLLIFFLLTATYSKNPTIDIDTPSASMSKVTDHKESITIGVRKNGDIVYNSKAVSISELEGILSAEYSENSDAVVIIMGDKESTHGKIIEVLDLSKKVGFKKRSISTQRRPIKEKPSSRDK